MRSSTATAFAIAGLVVLVSLLGAVSPLRPASTSSPKPLVTDAVPVPEGATPTPLSPATPVDLGLTLAFSNQSRLAEFLAHVEDPESTEYRHFLTATEFRQQFGPSASSVRLLRQELRAAGASTILTSPDGVLVQTELPASGIEAFLSVRPVAYLTPSGGRGVTVLGSPTLPESLEGLVVGITGLSAGAAPAPAQVSTTVESPELPVTSASPAFVRDGLQDWYIGTDYAQAYGVPALLPGAHGMAGATYPDHVAIATLGGSGYNESTSTALPPWDPEVVDAYYNDTFPAGWPLPHISGVPVALPGVATPPAPGSPGVLNDSLGYSVENSLDLEMAGSLAPGAELVNFYFSAAAFYTGFPPTAPTIAAYFADDLAAALGHTYPDAKLAVVSVSYGLDDLNSSSWDAELTEAAAMGVTIVAASGDQGDTGLNAKGESAAPVWPATAAFDTNGSVSVGGVSLQLSGSPTGTFHGDSINVSYDPSIEGISSQTVWYEESTNGEFAGSEGGISLIYAEPSWQFHSAAQPPIVNATERQGTSRLGRAGPDVAMAANNTITFVSANATGVPYFEVLGGTSIAAPLFAGVLGDVVAYENATLLGGRTGLGFLDPEMYRIASYYAANPSVNNSDPFLDVVHGKNALFAAAPGWDAATGWGGIKAAALLVAADENTTVADYQYVGPTPGLPPASSSGWTLTEVAALVAIGVVAVLVAVYAVRSRRRSAARASAPSAYVVQPPAWATIGPPTGIAPTATFSCPYCGADRPAEAGHCPACGAM